mgnify:CR=1 FL=1
MRLKPLHGRIIVKRVEKDEKTSGRIIIPDTAKEKPEQGKVVAVDPCKVAEDGNLISLSMEEGDRILLSRHAGTGIHIEAGDLVIMHEDDILAVFE